MTHQRIRLLAQAQRWNARQTEEDEPCDMCEKELNEHNLRGCIMKARVRSDFWG